MYIKIQCSCGTKFGFDVEPVGGRMPVGIACPACHNNATDLANAQIRQQLGLASSAASPAASSAAIPAQHIPVAQPLEHAATESAATPRATIHREPPPQTIGAPGQAQTCLKHIGKRVVDTCRICGKPICRKCMAMFGYVCSVYCQNKAQAEGIELPVYERQRSVIQQKSRNRTRAVVVGVGTLIALLITVAIIYKAYASKPRVIQTFSLGTNEFEIGVCKLLDDDTCLSIAAGQISLHDLKSGHAAWTESMYDPQDEEEWAYRFGGEVALLHQQGDLWLLSGDRILCYDRATGDKKHSVQVEGQIEDHAADDSFITVISVPEDGFGTTRRTVTRIALADAQTQTIELGEVSTNLLERDDGDSSDTEKTSYIATGPNVAELQVKLLESISLRHDTIKKPKESVLDSGTVSGANAMQAAEELLNEMAREQTGGVEYEDASRYRVTLRRHLEPEAKEWTGEVVGRVAFHPMKTVDLLVAGKSVRVFDKHNTLKWESPLTYLTMDASDLEFEKHPAPALESNGTLYFYDKGMLTAFDLGNGNPRWRVPSVGIWQVLDDGRGSLYVCTSSAGAEDIQYSQQIKIIEMPESVLMKVDSESGKVLWQTRQAGQNCFLSGKYVYATKSTLDPSFAINPENSGTHFRVIRIDPKTGSRLWTYYQPQTAMSLDFMDNLILLQFPDKVQILKFMSL